MPKVTRLVRAQTSLFSQTLSPFSTAEKNSVAMIIPHSTQLPTLYSTFHFNHFLSTPITFLINSNSWLFFSLFLLIFFSIRCTCTLSILTHTKFQTEHKVGFFLSVVLLLWHNCWDSSLSSYCATP